MSKCRTILGLSFLGVAGYFAWDYYQNINARKLGAKDESELKAYINGMVRGAGSFDQAINALSDWENYWLVYAPEPCPIEYIQSIFDYGLQRVNDIYG